MKRKVKVIITIVLSAVILIGALVILSKIFTPKKISHVSTRSTWNGYYYDTEDELDVIFCGPSPVYYGILPTELYDRYGITSYDVSSPSMRMEFIKVYVEEALRTKDVSLVVVETNLYSSYSYDLLEGMTRTTLDNMKLSLPKLKGIVHTLQKSTLDQSFLSYIFPLLRYHDRWTELTEEDFAFLENNWDGYMKGSSPGSAIRHYSQSTVDSHIVVNEGGVDTNYDEENEEALREIAALCKEKGVELLAIRMPNLKGVTTGQTAGTKKLCDELGIEFLDCSNKEVWEEIGLDGTMDFTSAAHLNITGSDKFTTYIGKYLSEHYDFTGAADEETKARWEEAVTEARLDILERLGASAGKNYEVTSKTGCISYCNNIDGTLTVSWPMLSYTESVSLYREEADGTGRTLLLENAADLESFTDTDYDTLKEYNYILAYQVKGTDEVQEVSCHVELPFRIRKSTRAKVRLDWNLFSGNGTYTLVRLTEEGEKVIYEGKTNLTAAGKNMKKDSTYILRYSDGESTAEFSVLFEYGD